MIWQNIKYGLRVGTRVAFGARRVTSRAVIRAQTLVSRFFGVPRVP
jgi:hypothetical protein